MALQSAEEALLIIPNDLSPRAREARIRITDVIVYLHNLQNNTDLAVKNTAHLIDLKLDAGQSVDGIELLNNLMYSFGIWRDHETGLVLAETLKRLETENDSTTPGLTDMRLSQLFNELGDFPQAQGHAESAIAESQIEAITTRSKIQLAIAQAGQGRARPARLLMDDLGETSEHDKSYILYAKGMIALAEGRELDGVKFLTKRLDHSVQTILAANSRDTTSLLASLENSRERQIEREKALTREANLKAQKLAEQQKVNKLLLALLGFLSLALIGSLAFARYRNRISKELAIQTDLANDADRMKTEFLGMISHELRTPLNGIIGIADFLANHNKDADVRQKSGIILDSGNVLFKLVERIIDMSRIDGGKLELYTEAMPLAPVLNSVAEKWVDVAAKKGLTYTYFIGNDLSVDAEFDDERLAQCLNSLMSNAMKFTDEGRVHFHVTREVTEDGALALQAIVADTGMGMTDEVQGKLFTPFLQADSSMTRKFNGSGLSLAITQSLARMMDGDVTMMSKSGRGSEFKFTARLPIAQTARVEEPASLPLLTLDDVIAEARLADETQTAAPMVETQAEAGMVDLMQAQPDQQHVGLHQPPQPTAHQPPGTNPDLRGLTVLIVEDMPSNQDVIKLLLAPQGINCLTADTGEDALDVLAHYPIDIVLMDIRMPGMDGIETTRTLRNSDSRNKRVPIIALTADAEANTNADCMAAGVDVFLTKPVMRQELVDAISFLRARDPQQTADPAAAQSA